MCDPVSIGLLTAGFGAQAYGQKRAEDAVSRAAAQGAQEQQMLQRNINNTVTAGAQRDLSADNMARQYADAGDARESALGRMLSDASAAAPAASAPGGQSADYIRAKAAASANQMEAAAKLASLMGRAGAQGDMMQSRNLRLMGDASDIQGVGQQMRDAQQRTQYNMERASHKGDTAALIGNLAMLAGTTGAGAGMFAPKPSGVAAMSRVPQVSPQASSMFRMYG